MTIAIDFDGTLVKHKYPKIGKKIPFSTEAVKQLKADGHKLILWTYRTGRMLDEALDYCTNEGLEFDAVNRNAKEEVFNPQVMSRKIIADMYIDDRNIGGLPDWRETYRFISGKELEVAKRQK